MRRVLLLSASAVLLASSGCDRFAEEALPPQAAPQQSLQSIYVKGATELDQGESASFRAQPRDVIERYVWTATSIDEVNQADAAVVSGAGTQIATVRALSPGVIAVRAFGFDADGRLVARGQRDVTIVRR